jgi:prepilin-type N-terminal cleavage/methylation domain-containing protein
MKNMRLPKRGEKGFTLIELLIVVAILGVLAAVVIPNVGRFIGRGKTEAAATELSAIQSAVTSMMTDQSLTTLAGNNIYPSSTNATNDMKKFPGGAGGVALYNYGGSTSVNYVVSQNTTQSYYVNDQGEVSQVKLPGY